MALLVDVAEVQVAGRVTTTRAGRVARDMQAVIQSRQQAVEVAVEVKPLVGMPIMTQVMGGEE